MEKARKEFKKHVIEPYEEEKKADFNFKQGYKFDQVTELKYTNYCIQESLRIEAPLPVTTT